MLNRIFRSLDKAPGLIFVYFIIFVAGLAWFGNIITSLEFDIGEYVASVFVAVVFVLLVGNIWGFVLGVATHDLPTGVSAGFWSAIGWSLVMVLLAIFEPIVLTYFWR